MRLLKSQHPSIPASQHPSKMNTIIIKAPHSVENINKMYLPYVVNAVMNPYRAPGVIQSVPIDPVPVIRKSRRLKGKQRIDYSVFSSRFRADQRVKEILLTMAKGSRHIDVPAYLTELVTIKQSGIPSSRVMDAIDLVGSYILGSQQMLDPAMRSILERL